MAEFMSPLGFVVDVENDDEMYVENEDIRNEPDDVIILHMDIREPLLTLKKLLEEKTGVRLKDYTFWLQDAQELEPNKNLVDQCVKGKGMVQINVQIQTFTNRINILDVLKPTDAALKALKGSEDIMEINEFSSEDEDHEMTNVNDKPDEGIEVSSNSSPESESSQETINTKNPFPNWVLDTEFKKEQKRLQIPDDPLKWTTAQVQHWLQWAIRQFNLALYLADWHITGADLCAMTHEQFKKKVPIDPANIFWTHIQLLQQCKFVSVIHDPMVSRKPITRENSYSNTMPYTATISDLSPSPLPEPSPPTPPPPTTSISLPLTSQRDEETLCNDELDLTSSPSSSVNSSNSNTHNSIGQMTLWQFLLDLLTDPDHTNIIEWVGSDGEFVLNDPDKVAQLWGIRKNKPTMNYEKLSRALRYYYDGDMISKVSGKRFAYKFDCDLQFLIGYTASELRRLVNEKNPNYSETKTATLKKTDLEDIDV